MDKEMLKFIEIRNSYVRPKIGELSINEKALAEYEKFCLDLIKQLENKDEVIENITNSIKNDIDGFMTINEHGESNGILELLDVYLDILEDKEVE